MQKQLKKFFIYFIFIDNFTKPIDTKLRTFFLKSIRIVDSDYSNKFSSTVKI